MFSVVHIDWFVQRMPRRFVYILVFGWDLLHFDRLRPNDNNLDINRNRSCRTTLDTGRRTPNHEHPGYFHTLRVRASEGENANFGESDDAWSVSREVKGVAAVVAFE